MRVSVLGLGNMGRAFASLALRRGHSVTVWNRSPQRAGELVAAGAVSAADPAEAVANAEVALVVVADDEAVDQVCLGSGALAALPDGAVLANVSTVSPDTIRRLAQAAPAGAVLDSPVLGAPAVIARGEGYFFLGGPSDAVARLEPLWKDLSTGYVHCGPTGSGATMKLAANLLLITEVAALAEAIAIARKQGIADDLLRTVFSDSVVLSPAAKVRLDAVLDAGHPGWFAPALARKDLRLALELARRTGVRARVSPATEQLLTEVIDAGGQWRDFAAVIEALT